MRLTLRTMLAYMDDILEPGDAQDVGKKVEESEFASSLLHRIRDVTRRLRLAAPKLEGRGMGLDPNTVAEYLDNTLPSERVPDFEKVCLESDVHLAEVASAHQILALVLGESAEIDPRSRERMYALPAVKDRVAAAPGEAAAAAPKPHDATARTARSRRKRAKPEVPDYLRQSSRWRRPAPLAIAALVAALLGGGLLLAMLWPGFWSRWYGPELAGHTPGGSQEAASPAEQPSPGAPGLAALPTGGQADAQKSPRAAEASAKRGRPEHKPAAQPEDAQERSRPRQDQPKRTRVRARAAAPVPPLDEVPSPSAPDESSDEGLPLPPLPSEKPLPGPPSEPSSPDEPDGTVPDAESPVVAAEGVGRLITDQEVLLRFDQEAASWLRVPKRETVYAGDSLLALPSFRPNVALGVGATLVLLGGTAARVEPLDPQGVPGVEVTEGRLILLTVGRPDTQMRLGLGGEEPVVIFGQDDATMAIEVLRYSAEGADPETEAATVLVNLYVASGEVRWQRAAGGPVQLVKAPAHWSLAGEPPGREPAGPAVELPDWITSSEVGQIEKRASADVEAHLGPDRPIGLALKELVGDRRVETRLLALQCLAAIGEFDAFVPVLNDPNQKSVWPHQLESLRAALARGPATAARVGEAFQKQRGPQGSELYRMLRGYTARDLASGTAAQLVKYLNHDDLDFRVLSFWTLQRMTGFSLYYRPEYPEAKRRPYVQKWQQKLAAGLIVPKGSGE